MIGTKLAHFTITAHLGSGGMGDVYQATDSKLGRSVAIKLLPESFAQDAERATRFEREGRALASLNHPNIAAIHGIEESGGRKFLVMELVPGETLAERIKRGPIPMDEALGIAKEIAEGLEAAHEKGIIHRDLKPANVKITPEGKVKVLDFGLAKAYEANPSSANYSNSPTMMSMGATNAGMILGTAAYMSPEQARGRPVDRRTDIFSFGAVLFEMLSGRCVFGGDDVADILSRVLQREPDWSVLPQSLPVHVPYILRQCLEKDLKRRRRDIGDVRLDLEQAVKVPEHASTDASLTLKRQPLRLKLVAAVALISLIAVIAVAVAFRVAPQYAGPVDSRVYRFPVALPGSQIPGFLALSPDGERVVLPYAADGGGSFSSRVLAIKGLAGTPFQVLPGTEGARSPFWSPDGRFVGFFADNRLKIVPSAGGPPQTLCDETGISGGGAWNRDGVILFGNSRGYLLRVAFAGGTSGECTAVSDPHDDQWQTSYPEFLSDGNHFFYFGGARGDPGSQGVYLASLDSPKGTRMLTDRTGILYAPADQVSAGDAGMAHILFLRGETLMAQAFDDQLLALRGDAFPVADKTAVSFNAPQLQASVSAGTLVYLTNYSRRTQFEWMDRSGKSLGTVGSASFDARNPSLSPDGKSIGYSRTGSNGIAPLWLYDVARSTESRITPADKAGSSAVWAEDSSNYVFSATLASGRGIYKKAANGGAEELLFTPINAGSNVSDWSRDGKFIVFTEADPKTVGDIWYVPMENGKAGTPVEFLATDANETQGQLSPDGRWMAYTSSASGAFAVYIRPFPAAAGELKVSSGGFGHQPRWSSDGKDLFFLETADQRNTLMRVRIDSDAGVRAGSPEKLFEYSIVTTVPQNNSWSYSVHPNGKWFLVVHSADIAPPTVTVITNWLRAAPLPQ